MFARNRTKPPEVHYPRVHNKKLKSTLTSVVTTVTQVTRRSLLQLVDVESSTVLHLYVVFPETAVVSPVVANSASHHTICHRGMTSIEPPWSMRSTAMFWHTVSRHLIASCKSEAIPAYGEISPVAS